VLENQPTWFQTGFLCPDGCDVSLFFLLSTHCSPIASVQYGLLQPIKPPIGKFCASHSVTVSSPLNPSVVAILWGEAVVPGPMRTASTMWEAKLCSWGMMSKLMRRGRTYRLGRSTVRNLVRKLQE
jgi:hypothetical protein